MAPHDKNANAISQVLKEHSLISINVKECDKFNDAKHNQKIVGDHSLNPLKIEDLSKRFWINDFFIRIWFLCGMVTIIALVIICYGWARKQERWKKLMRKIQNADEIGEMSETGQH